MISRILGAVRRAGFLPAALAAVAATFAVLPAEAAWVDTATQAFTFANPTPLGAEPASQPLHIAVSVALQNRPELQSFLTSVQTPGNPAYAARLTPAQFAASYSPTPAQAQSVVSYLSSEGFTNIKVASNRLVITADGTVGDAEAAFNTSIAQFSVNGSTIYANTSTAQVPDALGGLVTAVLGLHNLKLRQVGPVHPDPAAIGTAAAGTTQEMQINQFPIAYDAKYTPNAGVYAIFMYGLVDQVLLDLRTAEKMNGLSNAPVLQVYAPAGVKGTDTSGADEWSLDSQSSRGMSGAVPQEEIWYVSSDGTDATILEAYNDWVTDDLASAASASFGDCEIAAKSGGEETADDPVFMEAAAQGQTLFSSSGDTGAGCSAIIPNGVPAGTPQQSYPGISDYALEVGGTTLNTNADFTYASEKAWQDSGGGLGLTESEPSWQVGVVKADATDTGNKASCDVSMDADPNSGANVVVSGAAEVVGGTSLSSPLWDAVWSRLQAANGNALPFAGPVLYGLENRGIAAANYASSVIGFNDITTGNNVVFDAGTGWDFPTGNGSPDICVMATLLHTSGGTNFCLPLPTAALAASPIKGYAALNVTFNASASTASTTAAKISTYTLNFGDGSKSSSGTSPNISHTYTSAGTYTAVLTVTDSTSQTSINLAQQTITVAAVSPPTAGLSASPASGSAPLSVTFYGSSSTTPNAGATIASYTFNFGDGSTSVTQSSATISHTYTAAGSYTVSLTVTDSDGASSTNAAQQKITVNNPATTTLAAPTAVLSGTPMSGLAPLQVSFTGASSTTPNSGATITSYTFNFGDGSASVTQGNGTLTHTYTMAGSYTATLSVSDSAGQSSSNSAQQAITVQPASTTTLVTPVASLSATPTSGTSPLAVSFSGSASTTSNQGATITSYTFNFGDGSASVTQTSATVSHSYTTSGGYTATLTVSDSDGKTSTNTAQQNISVSAPSSPALTTPTAALSATPSSGTIPLAVSFSGSGSTTSNSGATITSYTFNFGDGSATVTQASATVSHSYTTAGSYSATLMVTDSDGQTSTNAAQQVISANAAALAAPTAGLSATPTSGTSPLAVSFSGASSTTPNSGASITSFTFNFGDGSASVTQAGVNASHTYTAAGSYTATLSVTDSDGQTSTNPAQQTISVTSPSSATLVAPNAALSATPSSGTAPLAVAFSGSGSSTSNAGATITSYSFNFGDGSATVTQSSATVSHTYTTAGSYAATLTVTDSAGQSSSNAAQQTISVNAASSTAPTAPNAVLAATPTSGSMPLAVAFDASASTTSNAKASIIIYTFNFGDGSPATSLSTPTTSHTYTAAGGYTATLTVTDSAGETSTNSATQTIEVTNAASPAVNAPTAGLSVNPASGAAPLTVTLNGSSSTTPNAGATITSYTFNFGDGSAAVTQASNTVTHAYTTPGAFTATLMVTDSDGASSTNTAQQVITVSSGTSTGTLTPYAALSASPDTGTAPLMVTLIGSASTTPNAGATITTYTFDFGDGSAPVSQTSATITHVYAAIGGYSATLSVTDSTGASSTNTAQQPIEVVAVAVSEPRKIGTGGSFGVEALAGLGLLAGLRRRRQRPVQHRKDAA